MGWIAVHDADGALAAAGVPETLLKLCQAFWGRAQQPGPGQGSRAYDSIVGPKDGSIQGSSRPSSPCWLR